MLQTWSLRFRMCIASLALALALTTVFTQFHSHDDRFVRESQLQRHRDVLENRARNPWQYRVLSQWLIALTGKLIRYFNLSSPILWFISFRIVQNFIIFLLAAVWYRRLGLNRAQIIIGLLLLAWGMSYAYRDRDLEPSTYSEVIFYLTAAILIISHRDGWIPLISLVAAFNRETSLLIPFAFLACRFNLKAEYPVIKRKSVFIFILSLGLYIAVFRGLRSYYGWRELTRAWGHQAGIDMFLFNLKHSMTWVKLMWFLNVLPILCLFTFPRWPSILKRLGISVIPVWFIFHFFYIFVPEVRLTLVPLSLIFIPGALLITGQESSDKRSQGAISGRDSL